MNLWRNNYDKKTAYPEHVTKIYFSTILDLSWFNNSYLSSNNGSRLRK